MTNHENMGCTPNRSDVLACDTSPQEIVTSINIIDDDTSVLVMTESSSASPASSSSSSLPTTMDFISAQATTAPSLLTMSSYDSKLSFSPILLFCITMLITTTTLLRKFLQWFKQHLHTATEINISIFPPSTKLPPCTTPYHAIYGHMPNVFSPPDSVKFNTLFVDGANPNSGISTFWFMNKPCVGVLKGEHARIVFRNSIERHASWVVARHFKRCLGEDSIVMMDCSTKSRDKWRQHRNLIKVAFTKNAVDNMANKIWKVANTFTSSLLRECDDTNTSHNNRGDDDGNGSSYSYSCTFDALEIFKWATLDIFGRVAFDYNFGCTENLMTTPIAHSLNYTIEDSNTRCKVVNLLSPSHQLYWLPTKRNRDFKYHSENFLGLMRGICQERAREIGNDRSRGNNNEYGSEESRVPTNLQATKDGDNDDDLLTLLLKSKLESRDDSNSNEQDDTHDELAKMLLTVFFGGYDTSATLLSMAMWSIAMDSRIQQECATEAQDASNSKPSLHEDASQWESKLAYCRAVILETLRLHPPVYTNGRVFHKDVELDGCTIPVGARVYLPIAQIHTDERNFARPTEFLPERWVARIRKEDDSTTGSAGILPRWVARDYKTEPKFMESDPSYIPPANPQYLFSFSSGSRNCVGHRLALQESTIVFACLVRDLTVNGREGFVMRKRKKLALAPPVEMPLIFRRREKHV